MNKKQLSVIGLGGVLFVSLFVFGKKTVLTQDLTAPVIERSGMDDQAVLTIAEGRLKAEELEKLQPIKLALDTVKQEQQAAALNRSMAAVWDTKGEYGAAAVYHLRAAELSPDALAYMLAGSRFQTAAELSNDTLLSSYFHRQAIASMEQATALDPNDLDMRADLANAIVTGTAQPMRGIQQLLDIVKEEPHHLKANVHLARLAITSGQHDKAVERFSNIIGWYPAFADAYLGLGEAYYNLGELDKAIQTLELYKGLVRDEGVIAQVDQYINSIKSSTP
ncbi:MAG: tetratricopeptide repeat protein [Bacteroidia bacterium]